MIGKDGSTYLKRYDRLYQDFLTWEPTLRELQEFIRPNSKRLREERASGSKQTQRLFDTTAPDANRKLAYFLNGSLVSASTRFFSLIARNPDLMRSYPVRVWLDDTSQRMYMALQQSNFNAAMPQAFSSLAALGTTALFEEERSGPLAGFNGVFFRVIPMGKFQFDIDAEGNAQCFYCEREMTTLTAVLEFGETNLPEHIVKAYKDQAFDDRHTFVQCIHPRKTQPGYFSTRLPIASLTIEKKSKVIVREKGYHERPFMVGRWETEEGEGRGRGPGHIALPDIRSLNKLKELGLQAAALAVRPPLQVPQDGVLGGQVRLTPAAQNVMTRDGEIKPILLGGDVNQEVIRVEDLRQSIKSVFHRDLVALPDKNYMTATEIVKQLDLINRELGTTIGQVNRDLVVPVLDRTFGIMLRGGAFLPPPPELAGADLDIEFEGPLARAQRTGDLTALQEALTLTAGIAEHAPDAMDLVDTDETVREIWSIAGAATRLLRAPGKVQTIREGRAQAAQQQMQAEQGQATADIMATAAQAGKTMKETQQMQPAGTA